MEDRTSTYSSPFADPRGGQQRPRVDSPSLRSQQHRLSQATSSELLTGGDMAGGHRSAGYNRDSFFQTGREAPVKLGETERVYDDTPDEGWDVYADFNNAGPRYSSAFGSTNSNNAGYQKLPAGALKPELQTPLSDTGTGPVELVTVPALGAEWGRAELHAMSRAGKTEARNERWSAKWRALRNEQNGFLCIPGLTRQRFIFIIFGIIAAIGLVLFFTIPRVPGFSFNVNSPISGSANVEFSRAPANFSFDTDLELQVDTHGSFIPVHFDKLQATIFDLETGKPVGTGEVKGKTFPAKKFNQFAFPVTFNYTAVNDTDITWNDIYNACINKNNVPAGQDRQPLKLRILLAMSIAGLTSSHSASTSVNNAPCPFELPQNSI